MYNTYGHKCFCLWIYCRDAPKYLDPGFLDHTLDPKKMFKNCPPRSGPNCKKNVKKLGTATAGPTLGQGPGPAPGPEFAGPWSWPRPALALARAQGPGPGPGPKALALARARPRQILGRARARAQNMYGPGPTIHRICPLFPLFLLCPFFQLFILFTLFQLFLLFHGISTPSI